MSKVRFSLSLQQVRRLAENETRAASVAASYRLSHERIQQMEQEHGSQQNELLQRIALLESGHISRIFELEEKLKTARSYMHPTAEELVRESEQRLKELQQSIRDAFGMPEVFDIKQAVDNLKTDCRRLDWIEATRPDMTEMKDGSYQVRTSTDWKEPAFAGATVREAVDIAMNSAVMS